jgi:hypothetical protein
MSGYEVHSSGFAPKEAPPEPISIGTKIKVALSFIGALLQTIRKKKENEDGEHGYDDEIGT